MDKAIILFICAFVLPFSGKTQNWITIEGSDLGVQGYWWGPPTGRKSFGVNRHNGGIWWTRHFTIYNINPEGNFLMHGNATDPALPPTANVSFQQVEFLNDDVYVINDNSGFVYKYDDNTQWSHFTGPTEAVFMSVDEDSLWICQIGENMHKYVNSIPVYYPEGQRRIRSKNGHAWSCSGLSGDWTNFIRYYEPLTFDFRSADTAEFILDNYINDFKFMNQSDTLYLAGNQGFSIAVGAAFIDTLTSYNTLNQPNGGILEFEFDQNDNVWALFGSSSATATSLAFLDRTTYEWTAIYDENNSPIDFTGLMSLELDGQGNVYIMTVDKLHILEVNTLPNWLNVLSQEQVDFEIYPNPSSGALTIQVDENVSISNIEVLDVNGRVLKKLPFQYEISLGVKSGVYLLRLKNGQESLGIRRVVIK